MSTCNRRGFLGLLSSVPLFGLLGLKAEAKVDNSRFVAHRIATKDGTLPLSVGVHWVDVSWLREPTITLRQPWPETVKLLADSYKVIGQKWPIKITPDGEILDGVHRFRALKQSGATRALVEVCGKTWF